MTESPLPSPQGEGFLLRYPDCVQGEFNDCVPIVYHTHINQYEQVSKKSIYKS